MDPNGITRIVVLELQETTIGMGIETTVYKEYERETLFAVPIPAAVIKRMTKAMLNPLKTRVRGFSSSNSLVGEWFFNASEWQANGEKQAKKVKGERAEKPAKTPAEKLAEKQAKKLAKAVIEREQLAKAPGIMLPIQGHIAGSMHQSHATQNYSKAKGVLNRLPYADRGMAVVPFLESDSTVGIWLTDREGNQVCIPVHEGLYKSAVSRGKSAHKENPEVDPSKYVKRLIAEVLLGSHSQRSDGGRLTSVQPWVRAAIHCTKEGHEVIELTRADAVKVQKKAARDEYKRKVRTVMAKKSTPFGKNVKWQGRASNTRVEFSRG